MTISRKLKTGKYIRKENGTNRRYTAGDIIVFQSVSSIPASLKHKLEFIEEVEEFEEDEAEPQIELVIQPAGGGWYDVVNSKTGMPINDKKMRLAQAQKLASKITFPTETDKLDQIVFRNKEKVIDDMTRGPVIHPPEEEKDQGQDEETEET